MILAVLLSKMTMSRWWFLVAALVATAILVCASIAAIAAWRVHPLQVHAMLSQLAQFTDIRLALVVGGLSLQSQASALRSNPEIVVATPVCEHRQRSKYAI